MKQYLLRCGAFFDGVHQELKENVDILVEGKLIRAVGEDLPLHEDVEVIDLTDRTVMPGLIDSHVHYEFFDPATFNQFSITDTDERKALNMAHNCMEALGKGITTIRTTGTAFRGFGCLDVKRAIDMGLFPAARVIAAPHALGIPGGHWDFSTFGGNTNPALCEFLTQPYAIGSGAEDFKRLVRQQVKYGADFIKIMATGGFASPGDDPDELQLDDEELEAIIRTAHACNRKVAAHAYGSVSIDKLLELGIDEIEHGTLMEEHTAEQMVKSGVHYVPTLYSLVGDPEEPGAPAGMGASEVPGAPVKRAQAPKPPAYQRKLDKYAAQLEQSRGIVLKLILDGQLVMGLGSDIVAGVASTEGWREFKCWRDLGIPALRTLVAATSDNAKIIGREDLGVLAPGKTADITAWDSDILEDHSALEGSHCTFVMKEGTIKKST